MARNPLAMKLSSFADFSADDAAALDWLSADVRPFKARTDLIKEGDRPEAVFLLIEGWAMRYKVLPDGRRHIMAFLIPGDLCDVHVFILKEMDHSIGLVTNARVAVIPKEKMLALIEDRPKMTQALWWSSLVDDSVLREWLVNMGQRSAHDGIAHLLVEIWLRLRAVGMADDGTIRLPLTQNDIADAMGLTPVHVNRTLQQMRQEGLIELASGALHIPDVRRLMEVSDFDPNYLHLERRVN
jgi:CRP-like cAMP-binding protein